MANNKQIIFVSHGGGPMPLLGDAAHDEMVATLQTIATKVGKPRAVLVISAHWEAIRPTVATYAASNLIYDYNGFAAPAYKIQYPCPGEPELAKKIHQALAHCGIESEQDPHRGLDHGAFVPLKIMFPDADIPCVQLSLTRSLDASRHIQIGKALQHLEYDNLLVMGSGMSFHNLQAFFKRQSVDSDAKNLAFEQWLASVVHNPAINEQARQEQLENWQEAPNAKYCHPRAEHLLPLHVCYGLAQRHSDELYPVTIMGKKTSMFSW